jgi:nucleotide-binding universal stress UspA family protein
LFKFWERNGSGHKDSEAPVESVLVPVTGEPSDDELVRMACELVVPRRGMLHMLYVIEIERGFPVDVEIGPATAKGEQVLSHMEELARTFKCKAEAELVQARQAGSAVVRESVDRKVDTVILGVPNRQGHAADFSIGQTVAYVLKNAPCRVIVWRDSLTNADSP